MSSNSPLKLVPTWCTVCGSDRADKCARGTDFEYDTTSQTFHFVACRECGHQYLNPRPASSELDRIYPANYYSFSGTTRPMVARLQRIWESRKVKLYRKHIGENRRRILDVGCGEGRLLELLRQHGHPEWKIIGLEFDEHAIQSCRRKGFEIHAVRVEDFAEQSSEQKSYDTVIMLQLIEHVEDPSLLCRRVYSLLKPGGAFIIETPNLGGLDYRLFAGRWWGHYHFPRHWNLFSNETLRRMLNECGFEIVHSEYLISTSAWIISHHNFFKDRGWPEPVWRFFSYQNPFLLGLAICLDTLRARLGLATSNQRVIARKPTARSHAPESNGRDPHE